MCVLVFFFSGYSKIHLFYKYIYRYLVSYLFVHLFVCLFSYVYVFLSVDTDLEIRHNKVLNQQLKSL